MVSLFCDDIRVLLVLAVLLGAEQHTVCFLSERVPLIAWPPGASSSFLGGRTAFHPPTVVPIVPAPHRAKQPLPCLLACLLLRFAASRAAADTRPSQAILPRHHSSLSLRRHPFLCPTPHYTSHNIHRRRTIATPTRCKQIHPLFNTPARTALCRPRSLALHIPPPIHIPASASRIHDPRGARHSANSARTLDHCLRRLPTRRHVQLY